MSTRLHRREHRQRADRLEVRFDPLNPNAPNVPVGGSTSSVAVVPNKPIATPPAATATPANPAPVLTTTNTPVQVPPTSAAVVSTAVLVIPPLASNTTSSIPTSTLPLTSTSTPLIVQTTSSLALVPTTTVQHTPTINSPPVATFAAPSSILLSTPTSTAVPSSGMGAGTIAGVAAGSLAGIAILGVAGMWLVKRYMQSRDDDSDPTPFTRHSWMRNSVALPDDGPAPPPAPSTNPRPPTMIERKQANMAGKSQNGFSGYSQGGYGQGQLAYSPPPGGYISSPYQDSLYGRPPMGYVPGQPVVPQQQQQQFFSPIASPPLHPPSPSIIDETAPPVSHNIANPVYFSRHDSAQSDMQFHQEGTLPNPYEASSQGAGYATLDRSSVTPYQAKQYAEISRRLQPSDSSPSPFEDPVLLATNPRVDAIPAMLPALRTLSPVSGAMPSNNLTPTISPPAARGFTAPSPISIPTPASPKSPSFKAMPMSPSVITVPADMHAGRETPVQFGFNQPAVGNISAPPAAVAKTPTTPNPKRASMASRKSTGTGRPETMYDEEDAYGGI